MRWLGNEFLALLIESLKHASMLKKPHQLRTLITHHRLSRALHGAQVAKSIQMTMGLHDDDVAFFLAADEPATYLQVLRLSFAPSHVMWVAYVCAAPWYSDASLQHGRAATGPAASFHKAKEDSVPLCYQMCSNARHCLGGIASPRGLSEQAIVSCAGGPDIGGAACDLDRERHRTHWPALCKGR